jgi:deoxyribose-phosphate aldolase
VTTRGRGNLTLVAETTMYDCAELAPLFRRLHDSGVDFLQTSSGHQTRAVTEQHVRELRELLPVDIAVKAVGGVHNLDDAVGLLASGAVRVGSGSAVAIAQQEREQRRERQVQ